jgi:hypothetical protein
MQSGKESSKCKCKQTLLKEKSYSYPADTIDIYCIYTVYIL